MKGEGRRPVEFVSIDDKFRYLYMLCLGLVLIVVVLLLPGGLVSLRPSRRRGLACEAARPTL